MTMVTIVRQPEGHSSIIDYDTVNFNREQPPPYTPYGVPTVSEEIQALPVRTIIVQPTLKRDPIYCSCPFCLKQVVTRVEYATGKETHVIAGFICGFTFWCMLCCLATLPYLAPICKKAVHYCPNCKAYLGTHSRF